MVSRLPISRFALASGLWTWVASVGYCPPADGGSVRCKPITDQPVRAPVRFANSGSNGGYRSAAETDDPPPYLLGCFKRSAKTSA